MGQEQFLLCTQNTLWLVKKYLLILSTLAYIYGLPAKQSFPYMQ